MTIKKLLSLFLFAAICGLLSPLSVQAENEDPPPLDHRVTIRLTGTTRAGEPIDVSLVSDGTQAAIYGRSKETEIRIESWKIALVDGAYRMILRVTINMGVTSDPDSQGPSVRYEGNLTCQPGKTFLLMENDLVAVNLTVAPLKTMTPEELAAALGQ